VSQPLLIVLITLAIVGIGIFSLQRLPVDAYPDVSPPGVS
jgi:cobalt-zinc-cadmium resistance protein CzcA